MFDSHRSCVLAGLVFSLSGSSGCCLGVFGPPEIECPASMTVDEEVTLTVGNVDDGLSWRQQSDDNGMGFFVVNGQERDEFRGGEPDTRMQQITFRAERAGTVTIAAEEVLIGPPICFPLFLEMSTVACTITIAEE